MSTTSLRSPITTHVLDTARGCPAADVPVRLERQVGDGFEVIGRGVTNRDGRVADLLPPGTLAAGVYRITFETGAYYESCATPGFYPYAQIVFVVRDVSQHYHVPLLLSPYGYSTYRGS
ncbi:MAG: hydroxyisourate hydrolase [Myxococcales bacterium]|nr:hydroxyisourate hydrolase [Myxococcales bacterium]